jgi:hypothetical protein
MKPMAPIRLQADAASKLSRGAKAKSTTIGVGKTGNSRCIAIDFRSELMAIKHHRLSDSRCATIDSRFAT